MNNLSERITITVTPIQKRALKVLGNTVNEPVGVILRRLINEKMDELYPDYGSIYANELILRSDK